MRRYDLHHLWPKLLLLIQQKQPRQSRFRLQLRRQRHRLGSEPNQLQTIRLKRSCCASGSPDKAYVTVRDLFGQPQRKSEPPDRLHHNPSTAHQMGADKYARFRSAKKANPYVPVQKPLLAQLSTCTRSHLGLRCNQNLSRCRTYAIANHRLGPRSQSRR